MARQRTNLKSTPRNNPPQHNFGVLSGFQYLAGFLIARRQLLRGGLKVLGLIRMREMKSRVSRIMGSDQVQTNENVRAEMQTFLAALVSYPDRFAANPDISFEQHRTSLMMPTQNSCALLQNPD